MAFKRSKVEGRVVGSIAYVDLCPKCKELSYKLILTPKGCHMQQTFKEARKVLYQQTHHLIENMQMDYGYQRGDRSDCAPVTCFIFSIGGHLGAAELH